MNESVKIAVAQLKTSTDVAANFEQCELFINDAASQGAKMIFLPECFDFIGLSRQEMLSTSQTVDGDMISRYKQLASNRNIWLSLGGMHRKIPSTEVDNRINNTHLLIDSKGQLVEMYDKTHLFDVQVGTKSENGEDDSKSHVAMQESKFIVPGQCAPKVVRNTPIGNLGLAICYDMRFPELASYLRHVGQADAITYPSAFSVPTGRAGHWDTLLRARAIETQCFVIAAAQEGQHTAKRSSYGHSIVIDPWGQTVVERHEPGPGLLLCDLDLSQVAKVRSSIPVETHRRFDLFTQQDSGQPRPIGTDPFVFGPITIPASQVFYRSEQSYAFVNISPLVPGHILVSPIQPLARFEQLSPGQMADLYLAVGQLSGRLARHFNASSLTISVQDGVDAGQSVPHVHVHVLPRKPNDFPQNDDIYKVLQNHDKMPDRVFRSPSEMAVEANELRGVFSTS